MKHSFFTLVLLAASLMVWAEPAYADRDAVQFGSNINVARETSVHDAICFFCSVTVEGEVNGDVVVFFGNIHLSGNAHHDVVNFFGQVSADENVSVGQNMVSIFGSVRLGDNVSVGKDLVALFGVLHAPDSISVGHDRVVQPGWVFFGPMIFVGLVIVLIVHELRGYRRRQAMRGYSNLPMP